MIAIDDNPPEADCSAALPNFRAVRLAIRTRWARPNRIPGHVIANVLRGALGLTLRKLVCPEGWLNNDCHSCPLYDECAYGRLFAPTPPADADRLRLQQDLPRPFVIEPPDYFGNPNLEIRNPNNGCGRSPHNGCGRSPDRATPATAGLLDDATLENPKSEIQNPSDGLAFRLMLFGDAIDSLPYFVSTLDRLGHDGMGRDRVPFTIEQIVAQHPAGDEVLFACGSNVVHLPQRTITLDDLLAPPWPEQRTCCDQSPNDSCGQSPDDSCGRSPDRATDQTAGLPNANAIRRQALFNLGLVEQTQNPKSKIQNPHSGQPRLMLQFLTPLLLKSGSRMENGRHVPAREIRDRPPFGVIIRRLRDRLSSLCAFFGEPWQHPDFAAIGALADTVVLVDSHTRWLSRDRRSTRTGQQHEISGLVGQAVYEFPDEQTFATLAPLVRLAELVHVGKHAPWGNGAVRGTRVYRQHIHVVSDVRISELSLCKRQHERREPRGRSQASPLSPSQ